MAQLTVAEDEEALAQSAAERMTTMIERSIAARGNAVLSLTGGSTPRRLYALLGDEAHPWRERINWARLHLFWGDERCVSPDQPGSNFGMARSALLDRVSVPSSQIHRMRGELADARYAAEEYSHELRAGFATAGRADLTFDIMLLGLGEDAHVASIFPGSALLRRPLTGRHELTAAVLAPDLKAWRITLTPPALNAAAGLLFLVSGADKAAMLNRVLEGPMDPDALPAQAIAPRDGVLTWLVDADAATALRGAS